MASRCPPPVLLGLTVRAFAIVSMLLVLHGAALGAPVKRVLIVRGESPDLPAGTILIEEIQSTLRREFPSSIEFFVETIDTVRFSSEVYEARLAELYREKYASPQLDLIVTITTPAVDFVLRHRDEVFPEVPLLLGYMERRFLENRPIPPNTAMAFVQVDAAATLRLALAMYPKARRALVVGGTSAFDRDWQRGIRDDLRQFGPEITVEYETDSRVEDLAWMVATLPADTIVLYVSMTRDGANVPTQPVDVLRLLREAAHVPVFGLSSTYLGEGIVGGVLVDHRQHGLDLGQQAAQILRGKSAAPITTPATAAVDWREMQRFGMSAVSLPRGTTVAYRAPSLWEREKGAILAVGFVVFAEAGLILALVQLVRRRREVQRLLEDRLKFQTLASDLSLSLTSANPREIYSAIEKGLSDIAAHFGIDWIWLWKSDEKPDRGWESPGLRAGQTATFDDAVELPPAIQEKLRVAGSPRVSALAVPVAARDVGAAALFWVSRADRTPCRARPDELQMISTLVSNVLQRRRAEADFEASDTLKGAILDSLPAQVAVLDRAGTIIAVNHAWTTFAQDNGTSSNAKTGVGSNYLEACRTGARMGERSADEALTMIEAACTGKRAGQQMEYQCNSPERERWFLMRVEPLRRVEGGAVVTHTHITERKLNEIALKESEGRFRRMADALPFGVWMSEADGLCTYFNREWLQMTGRSLEEESGEGWLESVHPDDRVACKEAYLAAFNARKRLAIEYRLRRHDGEYRWLLNIGLPRCGSDEVFHGYVGGVIDITDRREAEQVLHDFNQRLIAAQEEERHRIARELHDHLNQQLALLAIDLQLLSAHPPDSAEELAAALQDQWRRTGEIASDVHAISHRLHPSKLEALGLVATMRAHCRDVSRQNLAVHFSDQDVPASIPPDVALCLFRVLEEALGNVAQHSGATEAKVTFHGGEPGLTLRISDTGCGFRPSRRPRGLGLVSMRERLQALGGRLSIKSAPGKGTTIEAHMPRVRSPHRQPHVTPSSVDVAEPA